MGATVKSLMWNKGVMCDFIIQTKSEIEFNDMYLSTLHHYIVDKSKLKPPTVCEGHETIK